MSKVGLYVRLIAKPGKEAEVADFLKGALPAVRSEASTVSWFALREEPNAFSIFDTFNDEAGREAHLNGRVAAALKEEMDKGELFASVPVISRIDVLADKLPA